MWKKISILFLLLVLVLGTTFGASSSKSSLFELTINNTVNIDDLLNKAFVYMPALRLQFNLNSWFGLAAEGTYRYPHGAVSDHSVTLATDVVFRAPLGFFEPSIALGPNYLMTISSAGDAVLEKSVAYGVRVGFDFNITDLLCVALEGKMLFKDLSWLFANLDLVDGQYFLEGTSVGLALKLKL